jgi:hypothetical protein
MKKYFIALLFGVSLMSMQTASAAMLTLTQLLGGGASVGSGTDSVTGSSLDNPMINPNNISNWSLELSDLGSSGLADLDFDWNPDGLLGFEYAFSGPKDLKNLVAGEYFFSIFPSVGDVHYDFSFTATDVSQVPLPAAVWLFGSALLGLVGVTTRKSQANLAA